MYTLIDTEILRLFVRYESKVVVDGYVFTYKNFNHAVSGHYDLLNIYFQKRMKDVLIINHHDTVVPTLLNWFQVFVNNSDSVKSYKIVEGNYKLLNTFAGTLIWDNKHVYLISDFVNNVYTYLGVLLQECFSCEERRPVYLNMLDDSINKLSASDVKSAGFYSPHLDCYINVCLNDGSSIRIYDNIGYDRIWCAETNISDSEDIKFLIVYFGLMSSNELDTLASNLLGLYSKYGRTNSGNDLPLFDAVHMEDEFLKELYRLVFSLFK